MIFENKRVLITGGTGSLGRSLVSRIMHGDLGKPQAIIVFSRDEDKQYAMELEWRDIKVATDAVFYDPAETLEFRIGDVRDYETVVRAVKESDIIIHAAALKQVPIGEYFPFESIKTNVLGTQNIIRALIEVTNHVSTMLSVSTDKACLPVNTYGMCKALEERLTVEANRQVPGTRFIGVRYGNVANSRGSVIPLFKNQIENGGPVTITDPEMTRFIISLEQATETVCDAIRGGEPGDIYVPDIPSATVVDLAAVMIGDRSVETVITGIRPGEKRHEIMLSEEEIPRTVRRGKYFVLQPVLPDQRGDAAETPVLDRELSSADYVMAREDLKAFLIQGGYI
jgi:FlaA1/EpsC-like NDP-sugar epimerase